MKTIYGLSKFFFDKDSFELQADLSNLMPGTNNPPSVIVVENPETGNQVTFTADCVMKDGEGNIEFWSFQPDRYSTGQLVEQGSRILDLQLLIFND